MNIRSRADWGARQPESVTLSDPKNLKGVVVHWFGSPKAVKRPEDVPAQLRGVQRAHQAGEFNDIAYNHGIDQWGRVWELRGFHRQTGANGNGQVNRDYAAVVVMIGEGDKPTATALASLRALIAEWRKQGAGREVRPHGSITGSECPGPHIRNWIQSKQYESRPPARPAPEPLDVVEELLRTSNDYKRGNRKVVEALKRLRAWRKDRKV